MRIHENDNRPFEAFGLVMGHHLYRIDGREG